MKPVVAWVWVMSIMGASARPWTNNQGKVIEAEMVSADGTSVSLRLKNGKIASVPLASLSVADRDFVKSHANGGAAVPFEKRTWPDTVRVSPSELEKVVLVPSDGSKYIYQSPSFEFVSQVKLLPSLIKEVARTFEATKRLVAESPWGIECRPPDGMEHYLAALYPTRSAYTAAGGPPDSGGVYMSKDKTFRIPFESLGIRKMGQSYTRDDDFSNDTLVHEITHQMMHDYLPFLPIWAAEGCAELTGMLPYKAGVFHVGSHEKALKEYIGSHGRENMTSGPQELLHMTRSEWDGPKSVIMLPPGSSSRQRDLYTRAALLVYYFNFLDGEPPRQGWRWMRFMDAVHEESRLWGEYEKAFKEFVKKQEDFLKLPGVTQTGGGRYTYPSDLTPPSPPPSPDGGNTSFSEQTALKHIDLLLDGRSERALAEEIRAKFSKLGINTVAAPVSKRKR